MTTFRRAGAIAGLGLAAGLAIPLVLSTPAGAHAYLNSSNPSDGAVLTAAPRTLVLHFSESVEPKATVLKLTDGEGRHLPLGPIRIVRSTASGDDEAGAADEVPAAEKARLEAEGVGNTELPVRVEAALPALAKDTYRLEWRTLSSDDLHATNGAVVFGIQSPVHAAGVHEVPPRPGEVVLRWLTALGAALLAGGLAIQRLGAAPRGRLRPRGLALGGGVTAVLGAAGLLLEQVLSAPAGGAAAVLRSVAVREGLLLGGLTVATLATFARTARPEARRARAAAVAAGAVSAAAAVAQLGHSSGTSSVAPLRIALTAVHLLAGLTWAGTLLAAGLLAALGAAEGRRAAMAALRRFGPLAAVCVAGVVVSGLGLASGLVQSVDAGLYSSYGRALLLKVVLVGVAGLLGLAHTLRLHRRRPEASPRNLRRASVLAEAGLLAAVLGLASVMASSQPARGPQWRAPAAAGTPYVAGLAQDIQESVQVQPDVPGRNVVTLSLFNSRRPAPGPFQEVRVTFVSPAGTKSPSLVAKPTSDGHWTVTSDGIDSSGRWQVVVDVARPGLPLTSAAYPLVVGPVPGTPAHRTRVSSAAPPFAAAAWTLGVLALLGGAGVFLWRLTRIATPLALREPAPPARRSAPQGESEVTDRVGV